MLIFTYNHVNCQCKLLLDDVDEFFFAHEATLVSIAAKRHKCIEILVTIVDRVVCELQFLNLGEHLLQSTKIEFGCLYFDQVFL